MNYKIKKIGEWKIEIFKNMDEIIIKMKKRNGYGTNLWKVLGINEVSQEKKEMGGNS